MGMAIRLKDQVTQEEYSFDPFRDIAYFWPQLVTKALEGCKQKGWEPWYDAYLQANGVTEEVLLETLGAYAGFCQLAMDPEIRGVREAMERSGFFAKPPAAQLVVIAKIGQLGSGAFWAGIRHAHMQGVVPKAIVMIGDAATELDQLIEEKRKYAVQNPEHQAQAGAPLGQGPAQACA